MKIWLTVGPLRCLCDGARGEDLAVAWLTSLDTKESTRSAHNLVLACDYGFLLLNLIIILCVSSVLFAYGQDKGWG